jgi:hypothetical protein
MLKTDNENKNADSDSLTNEEMGKHGITRVPVDYFHFGSYRYTNLSDAVAQAKRQAKGNPPL